MRLRYPEEGLEQRKLVEHLVQIGRVLEFPVPGPPFSLSLGSLGYLPELVLSGQ